MEKIKITKSQQAIDELPPSCKNVFLMSVVDRKSYKEIAGELGISLNTVKIRVSKILLFDSWQDRY